MPAVHGGNLTVDRGQVFEHGAAVGLNRLIGEAVGKDLDGAADIVVHELEFPADIFGKLADVQVAVHKQNPDHGGGQEVGKVVGHHGQLVQFELVLGVDGVELLIDRLQLLGRALQFLVGRQQLLIGRLQFAVDRLKPLDRCAQVALGD